MEPGSLLRSSGRTREIGHKIKQQVSDLRQRKKQLSQLPRGVVQSPSVEVFKIQLENGERNSLV